MGQHEGVVDLAGARVPAPTTKARFARALILLVLASCQGDIATSFPAGLEPLEDNELPEQNGPFVETLRTQTSDSNYIRIYARGYVLVSPAALWLASQAPEPNVAVCSTNEQIVTANDEPSYAFSFLVHYIVHSVLTVEWDDAWRFGLVLGTTDMPMLGMIKHQKTQGSDFIHLSEGTLEVLPTTDPDVSELSFVEHLDAVGGGTADVLKGVQHHYDALVAVAHGSLVPACPP